MQRAFVQRVTGRHLHLLLDLRGQQLRLLLHLVAEGPPHKLLPQRLAQLEMLFWREPEVARRPVPRQLDGTALPLALNANSSFELASASGADQIRMAK